MKLMSSPNCHLRFSIFVPETLKFKWQCSQHLELNHTCGTEIKNVYIPKVPYVKNSITPSYFRGLITV